MGFFDKKATCGCCKNECGLNRYKIKKSDAWLCPSCLKKAGGITKVDLFKMTIQDIDELIKHPSPTPNDIEQPQIAVTPNNRKKKNLPTMKENSSTDSYHIDSDETEKPLLRTESEKHIFERGKEKVWWDLNSLTYIRRKKEVSVDLSKPVVIEFIDMGSIFGKHEIIIYIKNENVPHKNVTHSDLDLCNTNFVHGYIISFSKKESKIYYDIYKKMIECLGKNIIPFHPTLQLEPFYIDEENKLLRDSFDRFINFSDILNCEIDENGETIISGNLGKALVGGAILGPVGAIAGAASKKKVTSTVNNVDLKITLNNISHPRRIYSFLDKPCKRKDSEYIYARKRAEHVYSTIIAIINKNKVPIQNSESMSSLSPADEILKYKKLLDIGAITQEEFNSKKKQLL